MTDGITVTVLGSSSHLTDVINRAGLVSIGQAVMEREARSKLACLYIGWQYPPLLSVESVNVMMIDAEFTLTSYRRRISK